jgi:GntR family transcriptional regulator, histidine utilization repressor
MTDQDAAEKTGFRAVKLALRGRIERGEWGQGGLMPTEEVLAAEYGCARLTVNRALRELADEGLVDRRRRAGTRVRLSPLREARFKIPMVRDEIEAAGATYRYTLLAQVDRAAPDRVRAQMGLPPGARVMHVRCLHSAGGVPFQHEERWISIDALPEARWADFRQSGPTEWLVSTVPYSEVEVSFLATEANAEVASAFAVDEGRALFAAERTTWWQGKPITHVRLTFGPGYRMTTRY